MNFGWVDVEEGAGSTTNTCLISSILYKFSLFMLLEDILSIVLPNCPSTALAKMNFGWSILDSYLSIRFSSPFPFSFLFKNLPDWTLNGKIVDSFFSHPIFLSMLLFKNLQFQLWMVRSCIPTFLMPSFLLKFAFKRLQEWTLDG